METTSAKAIQEALLHDLIMERAKAIGNKNVDAALKDFAPDIVQYSLAPPLQIPAEEALSKSALQAWFDTFESDIGYALHQFRVSADQEVAFGHGFVKMSAVSKASNEHFELWFRLTLGFRKSGGQWLITHEHESVPFLMDGSFLAATDLTPA